LLATTDSILPRVYAAGPAAGTGARRYVLLRIVGTVM